MCNHPPTYLTSSSSPACRTSSLFPSPARRFAQCWHSTLLRPSRPARSPPVSSDQVLPVDQLFHAGPIQLRAPGSNHLHLSPSRPPALAGLAEMDPRRQQQSEDRILTCRRTTSHEESRRLWRWARSRRHLKVLCPGSLLTRQKPRGRTPRHLWPVAPRPPGLPAQAVVGGTAGPLERVGA